MSRLLLVLMAVVLLSVWVVGCGDDDPAAPPAPTPTTGTVVVDPSPDGLDCPWQLTGPSSYSHDGTGDETLTSLAPGDYTLTWGAEPGYTTPVPASQTLSVVAGGTTTFTGTYVAQAGSITVDAEPNSENFQWRLTGPNSYSYLGTGDETLTSMTAGDYTLVWVAMTGWDRPDPAVEAKTLADGGSLTFTGTYTMQGGLVVIDPEPNSINAPWQLTGPASYSLDGTGDRSVPGLAPGDYTLTWGAVVGYDSPDPASETLTVAAGATITFSGTYTVQSSTGNIRVSPLPESARDATWHLDGPGGYSYDGQGTEFLSGVDAGDYTHTWGALAGHTPPDPISETKTLVGGEQIYFNGRYVEQVAQVIISPDPSGMDQPWHLDGPDGYSRDGVGYIQNLMVPLGDYTVTFGEVTGWITPPSETLPVILHEITRFIGRYALIWDTNLALVTGGKFEMGSPDTELGRATNENQHWVQLGDFYINPTEITRAEYGSLTPDYQVGSRFDWPAGCRWIEAVRFCNLLSARDGLDSVYTVDNFDVTWDQNANGYRLPTEAEWEYACRAGASTAFANGDITDENCNDPVLDLIGWYCGNTSDNYVQTGGGLIANAWGLYDMHGNIEEWCWDRADSPPDPYEGTGTFENPDIDPTGPSSGSNAIQRGGTYQTPMNYDAKECRSAYRYSRSRFNYTGGFRLVRNAP